MLKEIKARNLKAHGKKVPKRSIVGVDSNQVLTK